MNEDQILNQVSVEALLDTLTPADAEMVALIFRLRPQPDDWVGRWPPTYDAIGAYLGNKYGGRPLSEAAIRYRRDAVFARLRGERTKSRRKSR